MFSGYWIRRQLTETPIFLAERAQRAAPKSPLIHSIRYERFIVDPIFQTVV